MIRIHRSRPIVYVHQKAIQLGRAEYVLLVSLGMMDNKIAPRDLLIETAFDDQVRITADRTVLYERMYRLRKKIGSDHIQRSPQGYMLVGDVHFVG